MFLYDSFLFCFVYIFMFKTVFGKEAGNVKGGVIIIIIIVSIGAFFLTIAIIWKVFFSTTPIYSSDSSSRSLNNDDIAIENTVMPANNIPINPYAHNNHLLNHDHHLNDQQHNMIRQDNNHIHEQLGPYSDVPLNPYAHHPHENHIQHNQNTFRYNNNEEDHQNIDSFEVEASVIHHKVKAKNHNTGIETPRATVYGHIIVHDAIPYETPRIN